MRRLYLDSLSECSYYRLSQKLQSEYKSKNSQYLCVYDPCEGMPVAALYAEDGLWYRAQITKIIPNESMVEVIFIDYGNISKINIKNIRYLKKEFFINEVSVSKTL